MLDREPGAQRLTAELRAGYERRHRCSPRRARPTWCRRRTRSRARPGARPSAAPGRRGPRPRHPERGQERRRWRSREQGERLLPYRESNQASAATATSQVGAEDDGGAHSARAARLEAVDHRAGGEMLAEDCFDGTVVEDLELTRLEIEARARGGVGGDTGRPGVSTPITGARRRWIGGGSRVEITTLESRAPARARRRGGRGCRRPLQPDRPRRSPAAAGAGSRRRACHAPAVCRTCACSASSSQATSAFSPSSTPGCPPTSRPRAPGRSSRAGVGSRCAGCRRPLP